MHFLQGLCLPLRHRFCSLHVCMFFLQPKRVLALLTVYFRLSTGHSSTHFIFVFNFLFFFYFIFYILSLAYLLVGIGLYKILAVFAQNARICIVYLFKGHLAMAAIAPALQLFVGIYGWL